jgi:hypothetical protein
VPSRNWGRVAHVADIVASTGLDHFVPIVPRAHNPLEFTALTKRSNGAQMGSRGLQNLYSSVRFRPAPPALSLSRFSQLATQIRGKRSSSSERRICRASSRLVFFLRTRFARISAASPIHNSKFSSASSRSNQRACHWPPSPPAP